jgi:hypothetical protein
MRGDLSVFTALNAQAANEAGLYADQNGTLVDEPMHKYVRNGDASEARVLWI